MLLFDKSEYQARVSRVKAAMAAHAIDVLLVASPANQFWLTGYDGWSFYTPQMVVVASDREEPVWIGRRMDAAGARFTAYLAPENIVPYPDDHVGSDTRHPMDFVADRLIDMGAHPRAIGVETNDSHYTARWDHILRRRLTEGPPQARDRDGQPHRLSAGLGRADRQPARQRHHRAGTGDDLPLHPGDLART